MIRSKFIFRSVSFEKRRLLRSGSLEHYGKPMHRMSIGSVWLLILFVMFWGLGDIPLTDLDEGAFAEASREMLLRSDWISPWLLDQPRFDKPVLIHWLQIVSFKLLGESPLSARLPSAISGILWIGVTAAWARIIAVRYVQALNPDTVYLSALAVAGASVGILAISKASTADALLNALMVAVCYSLWRFFDEPDNDSPQALRWARWAAVFVSLGALTKGPIAILIALIASLLGAWGAQPNGWTRLRTLYSAPSCWLILLGISLPWYYLQFLAQGDSFLTGFFGFHNIGRYTSPMHGFSAGFLYYPLWIMVAVMPWTTVLLRMPREMRLTGLYRLPQIRLCWGIFAFVVVFFTLSATKLPHYGFYGLSGLIILMSVVLAHIVHGYQSRRGFLFERLIISFSLSLIGLAPHWWPYIVPLVKDPYYVVVITDTSNYMGSKTPLYFASVATGLVVLALGHRFLILALGSLFCSAALYLGVVGPTVMALRQPILEAAEFVRLTESPVITWRLTAPSLSFSAKRVIKSAEPQQGTTVVMHSKDSEKLDELLFRKYQFSPEIDLLWEKGGLRVVYIN